MSSTIRFYRKCIYICFVEFQECFFLKRGKITEGRGNLSGEKKEQKSFKK